MHTTPFSGEPSINSVPVLSFGLQNPGHPWWRVGERLAEALVGFTFPLLPEVRVSLTTPPALQGALYNPIAVSTGSLMFGMTTPSVAARMATEGNGPFDRPYPHLRAIAAYPHVDYLVFSVDAALGVSSIEEIVERRLPLRLVTGRRSAAGVADVLTFAVEEILREYGASYSAIERWGGTVVFGGPTHVGGVLMRDGHADALFHEAQMSPVWAAIAAARKVHILPIRDDVRERMLRKYGFERAEIPAGHASGAVEPTATVDFSGWLLLCRDDLPDEWAYTVARACDETRRGVEEDQAGRGEIAIPIDSRYLFNQTVIPLHAGALAYASEKGYMESTDRGLTSPYSP